MMKSKCVDLKCEGFSPSTASFVQIFNTFKIKNVFMFQVYSKLAEYWQSGYAQERNIPFQKEKTNHPLFAKFLPLHKKKKSEKTMKMRTPWKKYF